MTFWRWVVVGSSVILLCGLAVHGRLARPGPPAWRANVALIVVDTLRADHLSLYGYGRPTSPHLEQLGAASWVFEQAFTVMSHTLPAHVSLMTGLHPGTHGVLANGLKYEGNAPMLAERLRRAGYRTGAFVSGLPVNGTSGLARGFDVYVDTAAGRGKPLSRVPGERTTARALAWVREDATQPFFLFVHYFDTHLPYELTDDLAPAFETDDHVRQLVARRGLAGMAPSDVLHHPITLNGAPLDVAAGINAYDNQIRRVDGQIGVLLAELADHGRFDDTLIIVTADHGEGLGDHGYWSHGLHLYEEQIRIPLIVRPPGPAAGAPARAAHAVSLLDVVPTIAQFTPIDAPEDGHGRPLAPQADSAARWMVAQRRQYDPVVRSRHGRFGADTTLYALRGDGRLKYLRAGDGREELYNLEEDPAELHNLAATHGHDLASLRELFERRLAQVGTGVPIAAPAIEPAVQRKLRALGYL